MAQQIAQSPVDDTSYQTEAIFHTTANIVVGYKEYLRHQSTWQPPSKLLLPQNTEKISDQQFEHNHKTYSWVHLANFAYLNCLWSREHYLLTTKEKF